MSENHRALQLNQSVMFDFFFYIYILQLEFLNALW